MKTEIYYGLADCHGLESFVSKKDLATQEMIQILKNPLKDPHSPEKVLNELVHALIIRARANYQRHATVYQVELLEENAAKVKEFLNNNDPINALLYLKKVAVETSIAKDPMLKHMWNHIPNPAIDPMYHIKEDNEGNTDQNNNRNKRPRKKDQRHS